MIDIGAVNEFFIADSDPSYHNQVRGVVDPFRSRIFWLYRSRNTATNYDSLICFDYGLNRWTMRRTALVEVVAAATAGVSTDDLGDIDALTYSLDDASFSSDIPSVGVFDPAFKLGFFSGQNAEATLETSDIELSQGRRSFVSGWRPLVDGTASTRGSLGARALLRSAKIYTAEVMQHSATGIFPARSDARYHSFKLRIPAGQSWTRITGLDPFY